MGSHYPFERSKNNKSNKKKKIQKIDVNVMAEI